MAAWDCAVDEIVVDERCRVDHLHDRRQCVVLARYAPHGFRREQQQGGAQPLAADAERVLGQLVDEWVGMPQLLLQAAIDQREI